MEAALILIAIGIAVVAATVHRVVRTVVVHEGYRALITRRGTVERELEPGLHRLFGRHVQVRLIDVRPAYVTVAGQELLTGDGIGLRISLVVVYQVVDVRAALVATTSYEHAAHLLVQLALREAVATRTIDEVMAQRGELAAQLSALAAAPLAELGLALRSVDVRDVMFPGELKRVFAQVAEARQQGLAALERARGETAALRNLANAARTVADNPALLQLRMLQVMESSVGNTFVIGRGEAPSA